MRSFISDMFIAAILAMLAITGVQAYHLFFAAADPVEELMEKYGAPSAGDPARIQTERDDLSKRAAAQQNQLR